MTWWARLVSRIAGRPLPTDEPFDETYPDSTPPRFVDSDQFRFVPEIPPGMRAPDTEPTSPGALDTDPQRLEP